MKYKVGDCVRIKSLDWYDKNKDINGNVDCGFKLFTYEMSKFCGQVMIITYISSLNIMTMGMSAHYWTDDMIEGLVEEETKNWADVSISDDPFTVTYGSPSMNDSISKNNIHNGIILPEGYIFKDENGNVINATKIVLEKKKKEYPKTYEECCEVIGVSRHDVEIDLPQPYQQNMFNLFKLLICRDAYWKIAGTEMGLGKPWEPDWEECNHPSHCIFIGLGNFKHLSHILAFPTAEMRDAFYENFKEELEICKELL